MSRFNIQSLDLNLLSVFVVVWETRNVSRAAERLSLTQSAISHALRRLRTRIEDPLFVPGRDGLVPTPRATEIIGPIQNALQQITNVLRTRATFEPATDEIELRIGSNDLVESWLIPRIHGLVCAEAPGVVLRSVPMADLKTTEELLEKGELELIITRHPCRTANVQSEQLIQFNFVTMVRKSEAPPTEDMSLSFYLERPHVVFHRQNPNPNQIDAALSELGLQRKIGASVQTFYAMLATAAQTGYLCTVPDRMLPGLAQAFDLSVHQLPFTTVPVSLYLTWHVRYAADPALVWLIHCVKEAARTVNSVRSHVAYSGLERAHELKMYQRGIRVH